jgi:hypothetical protein
MGSDEVRRAAASVRRIADDVRRSADQTLAAESVRWQSTAAEGFRLRLLRERARLRETGSALDAATEALLRHAGALDRADRINRVVGFHG